jgi:hypothetical protein
MFYSKSIKNKKEKGLTDAELNGEQSKFKAGFAVQPKPDMLPSTTKSLSRRLASRTLQILHPRIENNYSNCSSSIVMVDAKKQPINKRN